MHNAAAALVHQGHPLLTSCGNLSYEASLWALLKHGGHGGVVTFPTLQHRWNELVPAHLQGEPILEHGLAGVWLECAAQFFTNAFGPTAKRPTPAQLRDSAIICLAEQVFVGWTKAGGTIAGLVAHRVRRERPTHWINDSIESAAVNKGAVHDATGRSHARIKRVGGRRLASSQPCAPSEPPNARITDLQVASLEDLPPIYQEGEWPDGALIHFTRATPGPWPDQCRRGYLSELFDMEHIYDHSALASLRRIIAGKCIVAGSRLIRGGYSMVCFTEMAPREAKEVRQYRQHLRRWDFEPYGIAFRRSYLASLGARPVLYVDPSAYTTLAASQRPYFQAHQPPDLDYRFEREWRFAGNLDFRNVPYENVRLVLPIVS